MLAKRVSELPTAGELDFEPKWDGFRALIFRDGKEVMIQSRDEKPLNRYFPELIDPVLKQLPKRCVLDGEIVVAQKGALDFDSLQLAHSSSRVASQTTFRTDSGLDRLLRSTLLKARKTCAASRLRNVAASWSRCSHLLKPPLHLTPATSDFDQSRQTGFVVLKAPVSTVWLPSQFRDLRIEQARDAQGQTRARL